MSLLLLLHLIGAVLFLGNIVTAAFWKVRADLQSDIGIIHSTNKNLMLADVVFTLPGLILIIVSGILMAAREGALSEGFNWLTLSLILFAVTGVVWLAILIPLQRAMIRHSSPAAASGGLPEAYRKATRLWNGFGIAATLLSLAILYLMVTKGF